MKFTISLLLLVSIVFLTSSNIVSDDLMLKKTKSGDYEERFFVNKEQPTIKQDQYVKLYTNLMGVKEIVEMGNYEQNQKSGLWIEFNFQSSTNMIKSLGSFVQGVREGEWSYYYKNYSGFGLLKNLFNKEKEAINQTSLSIPKAKNEICTLNIDTTNVRLMETGRYEKGKKSGVWEYYSLEGNLLQKYDHTQRKLLENNESPEKFMIYLGGFDRFNNFTKFDIPLETVKSLGDTNMLDFIVKETGFELASCKGDSIMIDLVTNMLNSAPNNWICLRSEETKSLHYLFEFFKDPVTLIYKYKVRFKYIDTIAMKKEVLEPPLLISPNN